MITGIFERLCLLEQYHGYTKGCVSVKRRSCMQGGHKPAFKKTVYPEQHRGKFHYQPAVPLHIRNFVECGLIMVKRQGRQPFCKTRPGQLNEVFPRVEQYEIYRAWKMDAPGAYPLKDAQMK